MHWPRRQLDEIARQLDAGWIDPPEAYAGVDQLAREFIAAEAAELARYCEEAQQVPD